MTIFKIALASPPVPASPARAVALARSAVEQAGRERAGIVCFPECFLPGYRIGRELPPPDHGFLESAWAAIAAAARSAGIAVILGTERLIAGKLLISALVIQSDGAVAGFQDKVQLDPSEDGLYSPGAGRSVFQSGPLKFGIVLCHEGWRYPETVRWSARRGAQVVFHPHFGVAEPGSYRPVNFADPANTFHEKAALCRAAENTCYFATVNCASPGSPTTSAVARPDGSLLCFQPYGVPGLLLADLDLAAATGFLAARCKTAVL